MEYSRMATHEIVVSGGVDNDSGAIATKTVSNTRFVSHNPVSSGYVSGTHNGDDADKALLGYTFDKETNSLIAQRSKDAIGATAVLKSASIYPQYLRSINSIETHRAVKSSTAIRDGFFNVSTGKFSPGYPATATDSFGNDNAARSSYAVPGSITFMKNGVTATSQNYEAKG